MLSAVPGIRDSLARLADDDADSMCIGAFALRTFQGIDAALSPIISQRGVTALYRRSLYLIRSSHPWMDPVYEGDFEPGDFEPLQHAFAQQTATDALAGAAALLTTFHDLLTSLIGEALTERLLRSIRHTSPSGDAVQDLSP